MEAKQYKPTQFHYSALNEQGELLILNTFTGKLYKTHPHNAESIEKILTQNIIDRNAIPFKGLIKSRVLVPSQADEFAFFHSMIENFIHNPALGLMVLPTHQCNCRCVYCYEDFKSGVMLKSVQNNLIKFVSGQLNNCSSLDVAWFGGEPLIAMDVIRNLSKQFIEICNSRKKRYGSSMVTNGTLLTLDVFRELQSYRVFSYQITIDGTKETHDRQRPLASGGSSYDLIIENLMNIKREIKAKSFMVFLRINLTKSIMNNIDEYVQTVEKLFGNDSRFKISINIAADWGGERIAKFRDGQLLDLEHMSDITTLFVNQSSGNLGIQDIGSSSYGSCIFNPGCYVGRSNFFTIDPFGGVHKCAQTIRYGFPTIGELSEIVRYKVYEHSKWRRLADVRIADKCKNCFLLPNGCYQGGCVVSHFETVYMDKQCADEPKCPILKEKIIDHIRELEQKKQFIQLEEEESQVDFSFE